MKLNQPKPEIIAFYITMLVIIITLILSIIAEQWLWVIGCIVGIIITVFPYLVNKGPTFDLPWSVDILIATVFSLNTAGILLNAYEIIPGFVIMTQVLFSILIAFFSFAIIYILHVYWDGLIMDKYAMAFVVVVTTMASAVVLEFIKWFKIFGRKQTSVEGVLTSLLISTIFGIITALFGVSLIKKGKFDKITEELGKQIDNKIIKRSKKKK